MATGFQERLREVIYEISEKRGLDLVEVQCKRRPHGWFLRVYIDKEGGVGIGDCQGLSGEINNRLNSENDLIPGSYILEVSSPGLDRPLRLEKDFIKNIGRKIRISFSDISDETKFSIGRILSCENGKIEFEDETGRRNIDLEKIIKATLEVEI